MECPKCGYAMSDFDIDCPRCKRLAAQAKQSAPPPAPVPVPVPTSPPPAPAPQQYAPGAPLPPGPPPGFAPVPPLAPQRPQFGSFADPASKLFNLALLLSGIAFGCNAFLGIMGLALAGPFALAGFICSLAVMIKYESSAGITALLAAIFLPGIGFCVNLAFVAALATSH